MHTAVKLANQFCSKKNICIHINDTSHINTDFTLWAMEAWDALTIGVKMKGPIVYTSCIIQARFSVFFTLICRSCIDNCKKSPYTFTYKVYPNTMNSKFLI